MLVALALALSYFERFIPIEAILPLPGVKLGLANIVTLVALCFYDIKTALVIVLARCALGGLISGSLTALIMSTCGGLLSCLSMGCAKRFFSVYGTSVIGAAAFNIAQVCVAAVMLKSAYAFYYLSFLLLTALFSVMLTALAASGAIRALAVIND